MPAIQLWVSTACSRNSVRIQRMFTACQESPAQPCHENRKSEWMQTQAAKETDPALCNPQVNKVNLRSLEVRSGRSSRDPQAVHCRSDLQEESPGSKDGCLGKDPKVLQTWGVRSGKMDWGEEDCGDREPRGHNLQGLCRRVSLFSV